MTPAKILVVEDESIVALDIQNRLKSLGYTVPATASSGEEAIKKAEKAHPDLVLMDIKLKGDMDGIEAAEQIRARFNIPVIYLTAYTDDKILERAKITEPFGYILKPFEEREIHSTIQMALCRHRIERKLKENEQWPIFCDITERLSTEQASKQAEEQLQSSFEMVQRSIEGTIHAIAKIAETSDPYKAGHQRQVAQLARTVARKMSLPKWQIEGIRIAGLLHDIGNIAVPIEILSKPGKISEYEFAMVKIHPQIGYEILKEIEFPWPIAKIVLQHHERINGSGYPQGLSSEDILLEARIVGVSDVVEAMRSHRPYRSVPGIDKALEEISQNAGVLYNPKVVDACLKVFTEKGFKLE